MKGEREERAVKMSEDHSMDGNRWTKVLTKIVIQYDGCRHNRNI